MAITPLAEGADAELVARCREGDEHAWREFVTRYSRYVYAIATQAYRLSDEDAQDVFQDVFLRAYENLDRLRDARALRPWLAQLTRRLAVDRLRARVRLEPHAEPPVPGCVDDTIARIDDGLVVHSVMAQLSGNCREILDRFFAQDQSYRTIAEALGLPPGTVASRLSRCLVQLRAKLLQRP